MKLRSFFVILGIVVIIFCVLGLLFFAIFHQNTEGKVCFKDYCFHVTLATTVAEQEKGLMFQTQLDERQGMLFVFNEEKKYTFWMKNTLIPLDLIWINKDKKVVFISQNALPCNQDNCPNIEPSENAQYVLEVNAGVVQEIGLQIGDKVMINF